MCVLNRHRGRGNALLCGPYGVNLKELMAKESLQREEHR